MKLTKTSSMLGETVSDAIYGETSRKSAEALHGMFKGAGFEKVSSRDIARILSIVIARVRNLDETQERDLFNRIEVMLKGMASREDMPDWSIGDSQFRLEWPKFIRDLRKSGVDVPNFDDPQGGVQQLFNEAVEKIVAEDPDKTKKFRSKQHLEQQFEALKDVQKPIGQLKPVVHPTRPQPRQMPAAAPVAAPAGPGKV